MATKKKDTTRPAKTDSSGYWLVKQEPGAYSWNDLVRDGRTEWTGVRNFQARNNLRQMKLGDKVFFYHSGEGKCVVGIAEVAKAAYPDPTADDPQWIAVDLKPLKPLQAPVTLASIRENPKLTDLLLIRQSRLSVMPLTEKEYEAILEMAEGKAKKK